MKKKIGIVTIHNYDNYGNRLQNYATQEILKKCGYQPITIKNEIKVTYKKNIFERIKSRKIYELPSIVTKKIQEKKNDKIKLIRERRFIEFTKKI